MPGTGENEQALRRIMDMTRMGSVLLLGLHFYYCCYGAFRTWDLTWAVTDRLLENLSRTGLFTHPLYTKLFALALLVISLMGTPGRKSERVCLQAVFGMLASGLILYLASGWIAQLRGSRELIAGGYIVVTTTGYLLIVSSTTRLTRLLRLRWRNSIFNEENETFPQEERLLQNEYSVNLPTRYQLKGQVRSSWINIINPFRGLLVLGSPGSGKSYFVIQQVICQHLEKGFTMFVYDFKFDDLTRTTYHHLLRCRHRYPVPPSFYVISFDHLSLSHRCNPLEPSTMHDITDASESARTILMGLNREWSTKQGDFFVESPINFLTAVIWFLKKYQGGRYCTLPHAIELMQAPYEELFPVLNTEPEIEVLINPFISAYQHDAMEQLEGQVASAKIGMARLASPQLYWVLSGSDFSLDINDPKAPKIVCMGNNPEKQQIYGAVLSLYISRLVRQVNKKDRHPCSLIFDEFPTIYFNHMDSVIATARSNRVATTLGVQDLSQLRKSYGKDAADVLFNITGNVIAGQVTGETARHLSERFGRILQERESISVNRTDTSVSRSRQLDFAVPASRIAALSSGEFVGMVADNPKERIRLKMFHAEILPDRTDSKKLRALPEHRVVTPEQVAENYYQIKLDVKNLLRRVLSRLRQSRSDTA